MNRAALVSATRVSQPLYRTLHTVRDSARELNDNQRECLASYFRSCGLGDLRNTPRR